jgi:ubiquinone/menaquinone biosynthesis C-methylase UbiE
VIGADAELTTTLAAAVAPDGDVVVIDWSVDVLEALRGASAAPDVSYLIGKSDVLPLTDESVDLVQTDRPPSAEDAAEFFRVLRAGGRVVVGGSPPSALNVGERMLSEAGFDSDVVQEDDGASLHARKP